MVRSNSNHSDSRSFIINRCHDLPSGDWSRVAKEEDELYDISTLRNINEPANRQDCW